MALEFPGTSPNFHFSSPLWTNTALHSVAVSGGTERKTSDFFTAASMVKLEIERGGTTTSVELPLAQSASLHQIFNGGHLATNGALAEWRALSGLGYQQSCNRQGFNIQGQTAYNGVNGQRDARIGMYFNEQNDCNSPDSGRVVGGTSVSAAAGCSSSCTGGDSGSRPRSDFWVRISVFIILMPSPPPYPPGR